MKRHDKPGSLSPVNPAVKKDEEGKTSRSSSRTEKELKISQEKSPTEDSSKRERRLSRTSESSRDTFER